MYKALSYFEDLQDNRYPYNRGDVYPRNGYEPSKERIKSLASNDNVRRVPVILEIEDVSPKKAVKTDAVEEIPTDFMNPPTEGNDEAVEDKPKKKGRKKKDAE